MANTIKDSDLGFLLRTSRDESLSPELRAKASALLKSATGGKPEHATPGITAAEEARIAQALGGSKEAPFVGSRGTELVLSPMSADEARTHLARMRAH